MKDNYEWQNGISPVLFTDDEIKNPVKDSERNSNSSLNTETTKSKQHSGISRPSQADSFCSIC
jgi:hypothetical protein